jgi:hypothetical protein
MENAIVQGNKALDHNMERDTRDKWTLLMGMMRVVRKEAIERNKKHEEVKNAQIV